MTETHRIGITNDNSFQNVKTNSQESSKKNDETDIPIDLLEEIIKNGEDSFLKDSETDIPIHLLEEIVENGEESVINQQLENSVSDVSASNLSDTSVTLPAEQLQTIDSIFSLGSQEFFLNKCGTKRLIVGLTSPNFPKLEIIFKMHDLQHGSCVKFTKREWKKIVQHEMIILDNLFCSCEDHVYLGSQMRIDTILCQRSIPCVKFTDVMGNDCSLALETFEHMMLLKSEIEETYANLNKNINDVTERMKLFMNTTFKLIFKSNNVDIRHTYNQQILNLDKSSNFLSLSSSVAETWKQLGEFNQNRNN